MNKLYKFICIIIVLASLLAISGCGQVMVIENGRAVPVDESSSNAAPVITPVPAVPESTEPASVPVSEPAPTAEIPETPDPSLTDDPIPVSISELMPDNKSTILSPAGKFSDWAELYNYGDTAVDLSFYGLSTGSDYVPLDGVKIEAGEYLLVYCSSSAGQSGTFCGISIPKNDFELSLMGRYGTVIDSIYIADGVRDTSYIKDDDGNVIACSFPSPGYANGSEGYESFQQSLSSVSPVVINEVMSYNDSHYKYNGEYYDWVELKNTGSEPVNLSSYTLSDKRSELADSRLPDYTLQPGQLVFVYCTGQEGLSFSNGINAAFSLNAQRDSIFLGSADGTVLDYMPLHDMTYGGSMGRLNGKNGAFYFTSPTPGAENGEGYRAFSEKPVLLGRDGIYNDVENVTVTLSAPGTIYYTTNGSKPDRNSQVYTGPITLDKTTPFRAVAYENGKLPSDSLDVSFIINENHTLPVISLMTERDAMFGGNGVYNNPARELECMGSAVFYEEGGSFSIECGMKLHGETSKVAQEKKTIKLCFRSRYDGELKYDLFNNGITNYASILVRAAQEDYYSTQMRDVLMHQAAIESFPELPSQANKYCVLYINGQYWGLYDLREAHSPTHYAEHYGYDVDTVSQWKGKWPADSSAAELYSFIMNHDMSNAENYEYICRHLNIDSVIGWAIIQAYSGNFDLNASNMRFYYSTEDDMLTFALVDLDLGFFSYNMFDLVFNPDEVYQYNRMAKALLSNADFRTALLEQLSAALTGTLSNESMLARIDAIESELMPEVERDRARWGGSLNKWQYMVEDLRTYVNHNKGRAALIADSAKNKLNLTTETFQHYFSEVKQSVH